jgi:hypothetical protein
MSPEPKIEDVCLSLDFEWVDALGQYYKEIGPWRVYVKRCTFMDRPVVRIEIGYWNGHDQYCIYVSDLDHDALAARLGDIVDFLARIPADVFDIKHHVYSRLKSLLNTFSA